MSNRIIYRRPTPGLLSISGNVDEARHLQNPIYEGLVVDVIVDHTHPKHSKGDGYNVGAIKVRLFNVTETLNDDQLSWADPLESTYQELPLIGELVYLFKIRGNFFYGKKVPLAHQIQENGMLNLNDSLSHKTEDSTRKAIVSKSETMRVSHRFGNYFKPDSRVRPLKHFEGDVVFQGRMGQSIRFGSSRIDPASDSLAPNIILRAGQGVGVERRSSVNSIHGLVLEDINVDPSSLWLTSDQTIPFVPSTISVGSFCRSIKTPLDGFSGATIAATSGQVILNSKKNNILLFSNKEIYLNSFSRMSIDSNDDIVMTANTDFNMRGGRNFLLAMDLNTTIKSGNDFTSIASGKTSFLSSKIYIGSIENDAEPLVGGTSLSMFLARLILTLIGPSRIPTQDRYQGKAKDSPSNNLPNNATPGPRSLQHVITPTGPGQLNPMIVSELIKLYKELSPKHPESKNNVGFSGAIFNSMDSFVSINNENSSDLIVKNEFKAGAYTEYKDNSWKLMDPQYRVI